MASINIAGKAVGKSIIHDYQAALEKAGKVKECADEINAIFANMDNIMENMNWTSAGAEEVQKMYGDIHAKYNAFYQNIVATHDAIKSSVEEYQATDAANKANTVGA